MNDRQVPAPAPIPHRLLLARWHNRNRRARALSWLRATLSRDPVAAHADRVRAMPPAARDRHMRRNGLDSW